MEDAISLLFFILACVAAAATGLIFRPGDWYRQLAKPAWRPPDRLFGPVWLVLYLMIALSGWLVWRDPGWEAAALALTVYGLQLLLNGLWSAVFFGLRRPGLALIEILCLWLAIVANIALFHAVNPMAAYLLIPYAAWVSFAVALNFRIRRLNVGQASLQAS